MSPRMNPVSRLVIDMRRAARPQVAADRTSALTDIFRMARIDDATPGGIELVKAGRALSAALRLGVPDDVVLFVTAAMLQVADALAGVLGAPIGNDPPTEQPAELPYYNRD